jgi:hypothetical protein
VRGDSLRDLYAKALALLGLGLLGAAGALVNYWPVRGDLPVVASALVLPDRSGLPILHETRTDAAAAPRHALAAKSPARAAVVARLTIPAANRTNKSAATFLAPNDPPASLDAGIVLPPSLAVTPAAMGALPVSTLDLMAPVITAFEVTPENLLAGSPVQSAKNGGNKVAGAARVLGRASAWPFVTLARKLL